MQWSPRCLASLVYLVFSLVGLGACARPTVEEEARIASDGGADVDVSDADSEEPDVGGDEPDPIDEPDASVPVEAGCADRDHDTVCDAQDNCPDVANTNQADADKNGVGDACSPVGEDSGMQQPSACNAETVPASAVAGDATLSNVRVNGMSSPAIVKKGQQLSVSLSYGFGACALPIPQPRFLVIGIEGSGSGECRILIEVPCPTEVNASTTMMVEAPNRTGPAYVVMLGRQGFSCSDALSGAKRVAALCVE